MIVFLVGTVWSAWAYKNDMLGYGPLTSASAHGFELDRIFNVTLFSPQVSFLSLYTFSFFGILINIGVQVMT